MALIGFIGDISLDRSIKISSNLSKKLKNCDHVVGNLEGPLLRKGRKKWKQYSACIYNQFPFFKKLISDLNLTHVSIFNNHIGDYGIEGIEETIELLDELGIIILKNISQINNTTILNTGLLEYSGYFYSSKLYKYGFRLLDLLLKDKDDFTNFFQRKLIINGHFGIEKIKGISNTEISFFESLLSLGPNLLIRHQPHLIQNPFFLNKKEIYSSIGDFCFSNYLHSKSEGLLVIYDEDINETIYYKLYCDGYKVDLLYKEKFRVKNKKPLMLSTKIKKELKERLIKEYRVSPKLTLKRILKTLLSKEDSFFTIFQFSTDHIQPFIINELFNYNEI